jgi:hypothetical protein
MRKLLLATAALCMISTAAALAQEKHHVSFNVPEQNAKYNISQNADVGDVPGHIVRLFDTDNVLSPGAATVNGVELTHAYVRGVGELVNGTSVNATGFLVFAAANGDKFYSRNAIIVQNIGGKQLITWNGVITGGTGRFAGIEGTTHFSNTGVLVTAPAGSSAGSPQFDIEYPITKTPATAAR